MSKLHLKAEDLEGLSDEKKGELIMNADSLTTIYYIDPKDDRWKWDIPEDLNPLPVVTEIVDSELSEKDCLSYEIIRELLKRLENND